MRLGKYPGLRARSRKLKSGKVWTGYYYCAPGQKKEVPLGTDFDMALKEWDRLHHHKARVSGTLAEAFERFEREVLPGKSEANARNYRQHMKIMRPVFDAATWDTIRRPILRQYLDKRTAKLQGEKEVKLLGLLWEHALEWGMTSLPNPIKGWKIGKVRVREMEVTDEAFAALHRAADDTLKDVLDLMSATGLRVTDVLKLSLTNLRGDFLRVKANKTGKVAEFDTRGSVLAGIIERRKANKLALHLKLLAMPNGTEMTTSKLRTRWEKARTEAAKECPEVAELILRDMRKRAADLAETAEDAARLLQHSDKRLTMAHYRTRGDRITPTR